MVPLLSLTQVFKQHREATYSQSISIKHEKKDINAGSNWSGNRHQPTTTCLKAFSDQILPTGRTTSETTKTNKNTLWFGLRTSTWKFRKQSFDCDRKQRFVSDSVFADLLPLRTLGTWSSEGSRTATFKQLLLKRATPAPTFTVWCTPGYTNQAFSVGLQCQEVSSVELFCSRTQQPPPQLSLLKIPIVSLWWHLTTSTVAPVWQDSHFLQLPHKYTYLYLRRLMLFSLLTVSLLLQDTRPLNWLSFSTSRYV